MSTPCSTRPPQHPQHSGITAGPDLELLMRDQASEWCMATSAAPKLNKKPVEPDKQEKQDNQAQCKQGQSTSPPTHFDLSKVLTGYIKNRAETSRLCVFCALGS